MRLFYMSLVVSLILPSVALADACAHRPSHLIGPKLTASVGAASGLSAAAGMGMKAAGLYAISNGATGAAMLGSTAAGASAAGTAGILSGTAGIIGSAGAALMSPFVIIPAAVVAGGVGVYEGVCYLSSK